MEYLIFSIFSFLLPYSMHASGVDFETQLGMLLSSSGVNSASLSLLNHPVGTATYITKNSFTINNGYGVRPDIFADYSLRFGKLLVGANFSLEPLVSGIQFAVRDKNSSSSRGKIAEIDYYKGPAFGVRLGYNFRRRDPNIYGILSTGITPYVGVGLMEINYETDSYINSYHVKKFFPYFTGGAQFDITGHWNLFAQMKYTEFDTRNSHLSKTAMVSIKETEWQFGFSYKILSHSDQWKENATSSYDTVIRKISGKNKIAGKGKKREVPPIKNKQLLTIHDTADQLTKDKKPDAEAATTAIGGNDSSFDFNF